MANPHKGEVSFKAGDDEYILSFSANALAELEDKLGMSVVEIGDLMNDPKKLRMKNVRSIFWAGLLDHQPDTDDKKAAAIFSMISFVEAIKLITNTFIAAFPEEDVTGINMDPQQPGSPKPANGTGPAS